MLVTYVVLRSARIELAQIGHQGIDAATRIVGFFPRPTPLCLAYLWESLTRSDAFGTALRRLGALLNLATDAGESQSNERDTHQPKPVSRRPSATQSCGSLRGGV
jgi:hypothetical protein